MRGPILATVCILALMAVAFPADSFSFDPGEFGYSSEDYGGSGGSYLGVDTRDVTTDQMARLQLKEESGVEVTMVDQDAPAGKAGVKEHDVILTVNGEKVASVEQLRRMIREIPSGREVTLGLSREGKPVTLHAQLANRKGFSPTAGQFKFVMPPMPPVPPMPAIPPFDMPVSVVVVHSSMRSGLMVENLTSQLADFFGSKDGRGVLVRSVEKGSFAEKSGFHAGDVITRVNGETINDAGDFSHALRSGKNGSVSVGIIRDKKEQTLTLTLPERKESSASEAHEEIIDLPEIGEIGREALGELRVQLAQIKPQMEKAASEWRQVKPEIEVQIRQLKNIEIEQELENSGKVIEQQGDQIREQINQRVREIKKHHADI